MLADYEILARTYNEVYGQTLSKLSMQLLEELMLTHIPEKANILDLGCGTGQLAQKLLIKGYQIVGIDRSEKMLRYARKNASGGKFIQSDVRFFELPPTFDAAISMYALNYVMNLEELIDVFHKVNAALKTNGLFVFNLRLEEEFEPYRINFATHVVREDYAWIGQYSYIPEGKIGQLQITGFQQIEKKWERSEKTLLEKSYFSAEIQSALKTAGFREITVHDVGNRTDGYTYFVSRK